MIKNIVSLLLLFFIGLSFTQAQDDKVFTFEFDGFDRTYSIYIPTGYNEDTPMPLMMILHGRNGDGRSMARYTKINNYAEKEGFIALYPDGIEGEWAYGRGVAWYPEYEQDDVAFLGALTDALTSELNIDKSRRYVMGLSNGGLMVQRLACDTPEKYAAFATVAASGFGGMEDVCQEMPSTTAPIMLMHGTADNNLLWDGNVIERDGVQIPITYPIPETLTYWAAFNGCNPESETTTVSPSGQSPETLVRILEVVCPSQTSVTLVAIVGGGHNYPGYDGLPEEIAGNVNKDIDATEVIWEFFLQYARPLDV